VVKSRRASDDKAAKQEYEVQNGDTLGEIAEAYGVLLDDLMLANEIDNPDKVYAGQKLILPGDPKDGKLTKEGVLIEVPKGFTIARIADAYDLTWSKIVEANKLTNPDQIQEGQELLIPGARRIVKLVLPPPCFKDPVTLFRVRTDETRVVPLCFCNGAPNPEAVKALSEISAPPGHEMPFPLHPRLVTLLQKLVEAFPDKRIEIISGQRTGRQVNNESYHAKGQALDFRMEGLSNRRLSQYVRKFPNVGVGYYPNSVFIHMDTREEDAYWIDYSAPGERAIYGRADMKKEEIERIRSRRRESVLSRLIDKGKPTG
jgi:LysM repeat protein